MSKIFKSILKFIKNIIKAIVKFIKKFWWVILLVVLIWFAPVIAEWLVANGGPVWLSSAFSWVATTVTPGLHAAGAWLVSTGKGLFGAGSLWSSLPLGTKVAMGYGAAALVFPDEVGELTEDLIDGVIDVGGDVIGSILGASSGLLIPVGIGLAAFLLLRSRGNSSTVEVMPYGAYSD